MLKVLGLMMYSAFEEQWQYRTFKMTKFGFHNTYTRLPLLNIIWPAILNMQHIIPFDH